jgi:hypothetical protein
MRYKRLDDEINTKYLPRVLFKKSEYSLESQIEDLSVEGWVQN